MHESRMRSTLAPTNVQRTVLRHPRGRVRITATLMLVLFLAGLARGAPTAPSPQGERLYRAYCARCHGPDARGDGPDATLFPEPPRDLRDGVLNRYETATLVRRIRDGRALVLTLDRTALRARLQQIDALQAHLRRIPTTDWRAVRIGEPLYASDCERCHGAGGESPSPGRLDLADPSLQRRLDDDAILRLVRRGHGGMEPPDLSTAQERDLLAFVRVLSPGFIRYTRYCAPCHGDDGHAAAALPADVKRPTVTFDAAYFAVVDPRDLETAVWHMTDTQTPRMPHMGATLDEGEVRAIVEWLKREDRLAH
jgi:mono/diheme cytochrome c family protein